MSKEKYIQLLEDGVLFDYIKDLQQRIDKAIEYINKNKDCYGEMYLLSNNVNELLEILKGGVSNE